MNTVAPVEARQPRTYEDLARMLELTCLTPQFTEEQVAEQCEIAKRYGLGVITVRPSDLDLAQRWVGPALKLGAAIDGPHGYSTPAVKQYAARDALRRGAKEIGVTMNTSKLVSRQFQYLEMELRQVVEACRENQARCTVYLESEFLTEEHKIVACRIAKRAEADALATPNFADLALVEPYTKDRIQLKLSGIQGLDDALAGYAAGCAGLESVEAIAILDAWKARITPEVTQQHV